jgi:hypothetical protein
MLQHMGSEVRFALFCSLLLAPGCGGAREEQDLPDRALEVAVLVSAQRVDVHVHHPGSCREVTAFPGTAACETFGWAVFGVESSSRTPICRPTPTCVTEIRLERGGEVVAAAPGPSVGFYDNIAELGGTIVLSGCGEPITVDLPPPLQGDVEFDVGAEDGAIQVAASGPSVRGVIGRAAGVIPFPRGFTSACRSDGAPVELPLSDDFSNYSVAAFALGEPIVSADGRVSTYPAVEHDKVVSLAVDLGPVWAASVLLAKQSPLYPSSEAYCVAWDEACGHGEDTEECAVLLTAAGSLEPSCSEEWQALVECRTDSLACDHATVAIYSEDPFQGSIGPEPTTCPDQQLAYDTCSGPDSGEAQSTL